MLSRIPKLLHAAWPKAPGWLAGWLAAWFLRHESCVWYTYRPKDPSTKDKAVARNATCYMHEM